MDDRYKKGSVTREWVKRQMDRILEAHPFSCEYAIDGRYTWPDIWDELYILMDDEIIVAEDENNDKK